MSQRLHEDLSAQPLFPMPTYQSCPGEVFLCWPGIWHYLLPSALPPALPSTQPAGKSASTKAPHWAMPFLSPCAAGENVLFCAKGKKISIPFSESHFHRDVAKCSQLMKIFIEIAHAFLLPLTADPLPSFFSPPSSRRWAGLS